MKTIALLNRSSDIQILNAIFYSSILLSFSEMLKLKSLSCALFYLCDYIIYKKQLTHKHTDFIPSYQLEVSFHSDFYAKFHSTLLRGLLLPI